MNCRNEKEMIMRILGLVTERKCERELERGESQRERKREGE